MSADTRTMQAAAIRDLCKSLHLPTVSMQAMRLAEQAAKEKQSHLCFLEALLSAEIEEREQNAAARRIKEVGRGSAYSEAKCITRHCFRAGLT